MEGYSVSGVQGVNGGVQGCINEMSPFLPMESVVRCRIKWNAMSVTGTATGEHGASHWAHRFPGETIAERFDEAGLGRRESFYLFL